MIINKLTSWQEVLGVEWFQHVLALETQITASAQTVYPPTPFRLNALKQTAFHEVKVIILGQDPYHQPTQAHGLAFSVPQGVTCPPSLRNIFQELYSDLGIDHFQRTDLTGWANQGVLLLNTWLSVLPHQPLSHQSIGWEVLTDQVIQCLDHDSSPKVFLLWGNPAQRKRQLIRNAHHLVLTAPHPSPLSAYRGFFGCKHFSKTNQFLVRVGLAPIDWSW